MNPGPDSRPRLPRGVRLKHDEVRGEWLLLAPERVIKANPIAVAVIEKCDGARSLRQIVDELAATYNADRTVIERDVTKLVGDLASKRMVDL
ncbi:MAG TPA: pyrroloquinoline quinone biosynthesis peptide chaperone PqqD [Rhodoblastus sp.]|nr:pyrroloquinoline quinone biosynthesis peptide chaperone PqqD [Rhodoblastus sp.]